MGYIDKQEIYNRTQGGLEIIRSYYPEAEPKKKFKVRAEKTPSASMMEVDGIWIVTDFGDDAKGHDAISIVMKEEGLEFKDAIQFIATKYGINGQNGDSLPNKLKADFETKDALPEEEEGSYKFDFKEEITQEELKIIGPYVTKEACKKYHLFSLKSYTLIKNRKALTFKSTPEYPIFLYDYGDWKKLYKPKELKKEYRFQYIGIRPQDYIFGLNELICEVKKLKEKDEKDNPENDYMQEIPNNELQNPNNNEITNEEQTEEEQKEKNNDLIYGKYKLDKVIMCSGDSDAINVASLGYWVIWLNSETATFTREQYKQVMCYCKKLYNLPDIDITGIRQSHQLSLQYLDIRTIWLPEELKLKRDFRGNACKDLRDWIRQYFPENQRTQLIQAFKKLIEQAYPTKPWDEIELTDPKTNEFKGIKYEFNNTQAYLFLYAAGFYRYEMKNEKDGYVYIKLEKNIVKIVKPIEIKTFVHNYVEKRHHKIGVRNMMYRTRQLSPGQLENLKYITLDFKNFGKDYQFMFFKNKIWKITRNSIEEASISAEKYVWDHKMIDHQVKLQQEKMFEIKIIADENQMEMDFKKGKESKANPLLKKVRYEVSFKQDFPFIKYLWNASRMYWEKERDNKQVLIDNGQLTQEEAAILNDEKKVELGILTQEEVDEQRAHFVNKIFVLGYSLHRYKNPSRPWCTYVIDSREGTIGESNGGTGKSIFANSLSNCITIECLNGKDPKLTQNAHMLENVNEHTDMILVDDSNRYTDIGYFFPVITGNTTVNPKNIKSFTLLYEDSPKVFFTSNHTPMNLDPSMERRFLFSVFSDWYHNKDISGYYKEAFTPDIEFKKNFFIDWDEQEFNQYYNFMAQCLQFYLQQSEKINPPMTSAKQRILRSEMGEAFLDWAIIYFSDPTKLDRNIMKKNALNDYKNEAQPQKYSPNKFKKQLQAFCRYKGWELNPEDKLTDKIQKRIIEKMDDKTEEMIHIRTGMLTEQADIPF